MSPVILQNRDYEALEQSIKELETKNVQLCKENEDLKAGNKSLVEEVLELRKHCQGVADRQLKALQERIAELGEDLESETKWAATYCDAFVRVRAIAGEVLRWLQLRSDSFETTRITERLKQALKDTDHV